MLRRFLRKLRLVKPKGVYLGEVAVVPEASFLRSIDQLVDRAVATDTDAELKRCLIEWLDIPPVPATGVQESDRAIDVFVCGYRTGQGLWGNIFGMPAFVFWRPKVDLRARLYAAATGRTIDTLRVTRKMPWGVFWKRLLSLRYLLLGWRIARPEDMEALLGRTLVELLQAVRRRI